jgi:hypothetical protein
MQLLLSRAGLILNPGQVADLVLAWRQVAGLISSIPHDRPLTDDMALAFRLSPPMGAKPSAPAKPSPRTAKAKTKAAPPKARAAPQKPKAKAAPPKRRAAKPVARKAVRRRR